MKKVLVVCGAGIATSTVVIKKLEDFLNEKQLSNEVKLIQASAVEIAQYPDADFIVSTTNLMVEQKTIIKALSLITGIKTDNFFNEFLTELNK